MVPMSNATCSLNAKRAVDPWRHVGERHGDGQEHRHRREPLELKALVSSRAAEAQQQAEHAYRDRHVQ